MLEKDKNCIEFSMRSMMVTHRPYQEDMEIAITGMAPEKSLLLANNPFNNPFNIPCDVVVVPKKEFEKLRLENQHYRELAKQWEENHNLLLKKTGFDTVEELVDYIYDDGPNSQGNWKNLKEIIDDAAEDYISERNECDRLRIENEQLKEKLEEFSPVPGYREFLTALYPGEDVEKLVWATEQLCCGRDLRHNLQVDLEYYRALSSAQAKSIYGWKEVTGFSSVEEIQDYLTNEAEVDTLHEDISKLHDEVKYANDKWASANSRNNSWKAAAECNSPKELIEKRDALEKENIDLKKENDEFARKNQELIEKRETLEKENEQLRDGRTHIVYLNDPLGVIAKWEKVTGYDKPEDFLKWKTNIEGIVEAWKSETGCKYPGEARMLLEKWKVLTKCETPEAAATWITSYESACGRGNRLAESVEKLKEEVVSWKNVTGYSTPEDFLSAKINKVVKEVSSWEEITGFSTPEKCSSYIDTLEKKLEDIKDLIEED